MTVEKDPKRKQLLREFFLNATLIALINELGRESSRLEEALRQDGGASGDPHFDEWAPVPAA